MDDPVFRPFDPEALEAFLPRRIHQERRRSVRNADGDRQAAFRTERRCHDDPQGAITGDVLDRFVKARGGTFYRLDTGGNGAFDPFLEALDPFQEDGKNGESASKR